MGGCGGSGSVPDGSGATSTVQIGLQLSFWPDALKPPRVAGALAVGLKSC
jgi:hypothetical protein